MENGATLILSNVSALTLDPLNPRAVAVAIVGERIAAVGREDHVSILRGAKTEVIDCKGLPLIPGLNDAHTHVLATAAALSGLDCSSSRIDSVGSLLTALQGRAAVLPPGNWIRGYGLDPGELREKRYPTRSELDTVTPVHPVRIDHSSGHAAMLNSRGLAQAEIGAETIDPSNGVIERDEWGEPTGLLLEMGAYLRQRLGSTRSPEEMVAGVSHLNETLLSYGITSVQDAGPDNGVGQWETFQSLTAKQIFQPRVTMMAGIGKLQEVLDAGLGWGSGDDRLRIGHAKIMLTCTTGQLMPAPEDLSGLALRAREHGFPFAVHAIEQEAVEQAIRVMALTNPISRVARINEFSPEVHPRVNNRIEHCAECPPHLMGRLAYSGATVVTQPGSIYWRGDGYMERVDTEMLPHLYDAKRKFELGIPVAFGSDSPVIDPNPWPGIYNAVTGKTRADQLLPRSGRADRFAVNESDGLTFVQALSAYTLAGAEAEGTAGEKGMIRAGMLADLALLDRPLNELRKGEILKTRSRLTILGGSTVWRDGEI